MTDRNVQVHVHGLLEEFATVWLCFRRYLHHSLNSLFDLKKIMPKSKHNFKVSALQLRKLYKKNKNLKKTLQNDW